MQTTLSPAKATEKTLQAPVKNTLSKAEKIDLVAERALEIVMRHGIDGLTFSRLARAAGVSRPWLYKYVGSSPMDVVEFAVDHYGRIFAHLDRPTEREAEGWIRAKVNGTARLFDLADKHTWMINLYFRYYGSLTPLSERIRMVRELYTRKVIEELKSAFGFDDRHARVLSDTVVNMQLSMAYHWFHGENKTNDQRTKLLAIFESFLKSIR